MTPRTLKIVCTTSILLNIFLLAIIGGGIGWLQSRHHAIGAGSLRIIGAELPRAERQAFRAAIRDARRQARPLAVADRQVRQQAAALLRAPRVDAAALRAALTRVRINDMAVRAQVETRAASFVVQLPLDQRAKLADHLIRDPGRRRR